MCFNFLFDADLVDIAWKCLICYDFINLSVFTWVGAAVVVGKSKVRLMIKILTSTIFSLNQVAQNM